MKRIFLLLFVAIPFISFAQEIGERDQDRDEVMEMRGREVDGYIFKDASTLTINGKLKPGTGKPFERISSEYDFHDSGLNNHARKSTGLSVLFKTNSHTIKAIWKTSSSIPLANMTMIAQKGLDLYIRENGEWVYAGVGQPDRTSGTFCDHKGTLIDNMADGEKECLLVLPMFDRLESLEIGVEPQAYLEPLENPFRNKIVFIGSSIMHGASASRSGMIPTSRFERATGMYCINMGFSGSCMLQESLAHYFDDVQADAFILEIFSNPNADIINERFTAFMDIMRSAHPGVPMIMFQTERRETRNFSLKAEKHEAAKMAAAAKWASERVKSDKDLYFLENAMNMGPDHNCTVDGAHPTDEGFSRMLKGSQKDILKIFRKYGIK